MRERLRSATRREAAFSEVDFASSITGGFAALATLLLFWVAMTAVRSVPEPAQSRAEREIGVARPAPPIAAVAPALARIASGWSRPASSWL